MGAVHRRFVSAGINRVVNALDWGHDGRIAYGAHHLCAIYDPEAAEVESTMVGHSGMVNCVRWIPRQVAPGTPSCVSLLVSGAADNAIRVWAVQDTRGKAQNEVLEPWQCIAVLEGHTAPVTALACYALLQPQPSDPTHPSPPFLLVSTAGDNNVRVWRCQPSAPAPSAAPLDSAAAAFGQQQWRLDHLLPVGTHIQQALAITHLPMDPSWLLLATGGTDKYVHLYIRAPGDDNQFVHACRLPGHENWVRALDFCHVTTSTRDASAANSTAAQTPASAGAEPGSSTPAAQGVGLEVLLASASQDRYARVWSIRQDTASAAPSTAPTSLADTIARYAPKPRFRAAGTVLLATLDALLIGHEDWVYDVRWRPAASTLAQDPGSSASEAAGSSGSADGPSPFVLHRSAARLLTSSMDRTMMLWRHEPGSSGSGSSGGLWLSASSLGDAGAQCLGYFGGCFDPSGRRIVAHGFTGAMHLWESTAPGSAGTGEAGARAADVSWQPRHALGGHFGAVTGCCWAMDGACLLSVSKDQTARVFTSVQGHWCEVARPQVHGHDFTCVTSVSMPQGSGGVDDTSSTYRYVSGSEEKMLRAFEAPQVFMGALDAARGRQPRASAVVASQQGRQAFGAAIPALGLSNKAVYEEDASAANGGVQSGMPAGVTTGYTDGPDFAPCAAPSVVSGPPLEEHLAQNTLWPEVHKLYGHGNDVYCVAASRDGRYLASGCIAKSAAAAEIWVWAVDSWRGVAQLPAHTLTVTQLAWSHSDDYLASCSRDRSFSVFRRIRAPAGGAGEDSFQLVQRVKAAHTRVIWGIAWSPDDKMLATGARDEAAKLWAVNTTVSPGDGAASEGQSDGQHCSVSGSPVAVLPHASAVHSLAFAPVGPGTSAASGSAYVLATGLEDGNICLWRLGSPASSSGQLEAEGGRSVLAWQTDRFTQHTAAVNSVCWRSVGDDEATSRAGGPHLPQLQLASCADDHGIRVFDVAESLL